MTPIFVLTFVVANLLIASGYVLVAIGVAPHVQASTPLARVGGVFFFLLCGATHMEFVIHWWADEAITIDEFGSWHMVLVHVPQAISVFWFIAGLHAEQKAPIGDNSWSSKAVDWFLTKIATHRPTLAIAAALDRHLFEVVGAYLAILTVAAAAETF